MDRWSDPKTFRSITDDEPECERCGEEMSGGRCFNPRCPDGEANIGDAAYHAREDFKVLAAFENLRKW